MESPRYNIRTLRLLEWIGLGAISLKIELLCWKVCAILRFFWISSYHIFQLFCFYYEIIWSLFWWFKVFLVKFFLLKSWSSEKKSFFRSAPGCSFQAVDPQKKCGITKLLKRPLKIRLIIEQFNKQVQTWTSDDGIRIRPIQYPTTLSQIWIIFMKSVTNT